MHQPLSSLNLPDFKVQELRTAGYRYSKDVDVADENFKSKVNIPEWCNMIRIPQTKTALDIYQEECISGNILTSCKPLDEALGGGIAVGHITEFCGEPGCGKTQMCLHLCVNVQLPVWCGGVAGQSIYVSTNKGLASHRLREVAAACVNNYINFKSKHFSVMSNNEEFNVESILRKIYCVNIDDHVELIAFVKYVEKWLEEHSSLRLIVIDTISAPVKLINFRERTQMIYNILKDLQQLAQKYKFAIVLTNDVTTRINSSNSAYHTPSLGGSYYHRINARVELTKKSANLFKASVVKHVLQRPVAVEFNLFS